MNDVRLEQLGRDEDARARLLALITVLDVDYIPPISSMTDISKYCAKLIKFAEVVVAKHVWKDIGFVAVYANDQVQLYAFVTSIGIKPEFRGHGIGILLLNQAIEVAREKGMQRIRLEVNLQNHAAVSLYRNCGFTEVCLYERRNPNGYVFFEKMI